MHSLYYFAIFEFDPVPFLCWLCDIVGVVIGAFPSTPTNLTVGGLITSAGEAMPLVGTGILSELYTMVQSVFSIFLIIKVVRFVSYLKPW
jgi:hypothetical protein